MRWGATEFYLKESHHILELLAKRHSMRREASGTKRSFVAPSSKARLDALPLQAPSRRGPAKRDTQDAYPPQVTFSLYYSSLVSRSL